MEVQVIIDAIKENPTLVEGIFSTVAESEFGKTAIDNRVNSEYTQRIGSEISKVHGLYDEDAFTILGEKPMQKEDGSKEKTYDFIKRKLADLKRLSDMEKSLSVDERVKQLEKDLEKAKLEGGGKAIQDLFDEAKKVWATKETEYQGRISTMETANTNSKIESEINAAISQLKFNPDVSDSIKNIILQNAKANLMNNVKIEGEKVIFLTNEGAPVLNATSYVPKTAFEMLSDIEAIKEISLKVVVPGGGADVELNGNVKTITVDGKTNKTLELPSGSFKTQMEFMQVAEKALLDSGITRKNPEWDVLKNKAFNDYNVASLPTN